MAITQLPNSWRVLESISKTASADAFLWPLQGAGPLSRLLVLALAGQAGALASSAQATYSAAIRSPIRPSHPGGDRYLLWRDGGRREGALRSNLFGGIRSPTCSTGHC